MAGTGRRGGFRDAVSGRLCSRTWFCQNKSALSFNRHSCRLGLHAQIIRRTDKYERAADVVGWGGPCGQHAVVADFGWRVGLSCVGLPGQAVVKTVLAWAQRALDFVYPRNCQ